MSALLDRKYRALDDFVQRGAKGLEQGK